VIAILTFAFLTVSKYLLPNEIVGAAQNFFGKIEEIGQIWLDLGEI